MKLSLSLGRVLQVSLIALALLLALFFFLVFESSQRAIVRSAALLRESAVDRVRKLVGDHLLGAEKTLNELEHQIRLGACSAETAASVEPCLLAALLNSENLGEISLTHANKIGFDPSGTMQLAAEERWQVSAFRQPAEARQLLLCLRRTQMKGDRFAAVTECRMPAATLSDPPSSRSTEGGARDPTDHLSFKTPTKSRLYGQTLWTDLSYMQADAHLPASQRRVVVTALKAIEDRTDQFAGVLRVGLLEQQIDNQVGETRVNESDEQDPHRIFLFDQQGRLITRVGPSDRLQEFGDDLRIAAMHLPTEIAGALAQPELFNQFSGTRELVVSGRRFFFSFRELERTQGWFVGVVGPEDYYLWDLRAARRILLGAFVALILGVLAGGWGIVHAIRTGFRRIETEATRMRHVDFGASRPRSVFRDVSVVLESLEQAKTAMRAMGKYVPMVLFQQLYEANQEPTLGGELRDVSLMFTDIKDFTPLAEQLAPDQLARLLGQYFEAITTAIHSTDGIIDKYVGDSVMAIWNAPRPCPEHAIHACRAALECLRRTHALFASPSWKEMPPLVTRFGLHQATVMVGHFGAPDRMSYTALGDGVNLASRLEGLNKEYGTTVIASQAISERAKNVFDFRRVDRVAVRGKSEGVEIYELLGEVGSSGAKADIARTYESALEAYFRREFEAAIGLLERQRADGPSGVLFRRCQQLLETPPPPDWNGIHLSTTK